LPKNAIFGYDILMKRFFCFMVFITFCFPVHASEPDGKAYLQKGKSELEGKNYELAISDLSRAETEFPLLGDYALLWLSDAFHESGNHEESLKALRTFLKKYPHSSLIKKARSREIREAGEVSGCDVRTLFESYLKDYSCDTEMNYLFAQWLKSNGHEDKAKAVFKQIYIEAGPFAGPAGNELCPSDMDVDDMIKRASNLAKLMDYKGAEALLRSALEQDEGRSKESILKELGMSLFKQKRYREAAETYRKAGDRFWEVRSLYRAGEKEAVYAALDDILSNGEKKFVSVLMAIGSDKRREGKPEEAIKIFQTVIKRFPSEAENALWGIGWTHFLSGDYEKASEVFGTLSATYDDPKYLYWKSRDLELIGQGDPQNRPPAKRKGRDFYSVMAYAKTQGAPEFSVGAGVTKIVEPMSAVKKNPPVYGKNDRVEALLDLGLRKEALSEMVFISKKTSSLEDILYICAKSQQLGEYKLSVRSAAKVPYTDALHDFLYPLAYWDIVKSAAEKYEVDPHFILSIVREESRFDSEARSPAGAIGLMQLMPHTASRLDSKLKLGIKGPHDLVNAENNLHIGTYYLSHLLKEFGSYPYAIAAYNAGEEIVRNWIHRGGYKSVDEFIEDIPYEETRNYVKRVLTTFFEYKCASSTAGKIVDIQFEKSRL
jgi:soluble lytic murein transglycosylase